MQLIIDTVHNLGALGIQRGLERLDLGPQAFRLGVIRFERHPQFGFLPVQFGQIRFDSTQITVV